MAEFKLVDSVDGQLLGQSIDLKAGKEKQNKDSSEQSVVWLLDRPLAPYSEAYKQHLIQESYSSQTIKTYFFCIAHFAHWITQSDLDIHHINERTIQEFINEYLPSCICTNKYLYAPTIHAATIHLINILNDNGISSLLVHVNELHEKCRQTLPLESASSELRML
jgi:hypothetical protein